MAERCHADIVDVHYDWRIHWCVLISSRGGHRYVFLVSCLGLLLLGHAYMVLLVIVCQTLVYREVTALFSLKSTQSTSAEEPKGADPWRKTLNWYFFAITNYFLYGESIIYYFKVAAFFASPRKNLTDWISLACGVR